jgi:hypothetical protein
MIAKLFGVMVAVIVLVGVVSAAGIVVKIDSQTLAAGGKAVIPVKVSGASNLGAIDLTVTYDTAALKFSKAELGAFPTNGMVEANEVQPGTIFIGIVDSNGMTGDGTLADLTFDVLGAQGSSSQMNVAVRGAYATDLKDVVNQVSGGTITVGAPGSGTGTGGKASLSVAVAIGALIVAGAAAVVVMNRK